MKNKIFKMSVSLLGAAALTLSLCACESGGSSSADNTSADNAAAETETAATEAAETETAATETADTDQIPNPWSDCETAEEAAEIAGFAFSYPEGICDDTYTVTAYHATEGMIDADYSNGSTEITIRQANLSEEDISGDYNEYAQIVDGEYNGFSYTMKGNDNLIYLTLCNVDQMSYVIYTESGSPADDIIPILSLVTGEEAVARKVDANALDTLAVAGLYESADFGSLSVNMYTSTDPGMESVGCVYVKDQSGNEYVRAAEIIPADEPNVYNIDGTDLSFSIYTDENGTLCADVFEGDTHTAYLTMTQHFQS